MFGKLLKAAQVATALRPTDEQINSINATAYERLQAIARKPWSSEYFFDEETGSVIFHLDKEEQVIYRTRFKRRYDWLRLVGLQHGQEINPDDIASPTAAPNRYKRNGRRINLTPTYNVEYCFGHHQGARIVDLGAIQA